METGGIHRFFHFFTDNSNFYRYNADVSERKIVGTESPYATRVSWIRT